MISKILVGVDFSGPSITSMDYAADLANKNKAELVLLNVLPEMQSRRPTPRGRIDVQKIKTGTEQNRRAMLQEHADRLTGVYPDLKVKTIVRFGSETQNLIEAAKDENVDLIIVGNRGESGVVSWMLGSVSREIVESCTVPVLVVKDQRYCQL